MDEQQQRNYVRVTVRCEPCARGLGRAAPILAILERQPHGGWVLMSIARRGRLAAERERQDAAAEGIPMRMGELRNAYVHANVHPGRGKGIELSSPQCSHKPRAKLRDLYADADQAAAKGRDYFYR